MTRKEDGNKDKQFFQVDRFVLQNGEWFYMTREGEERGPFEGKQDAEGDLISYVMHLKKMESFGNYQ